jgi:RNA polymerase sigma-70 factor (ECF subfamily)
LEKDLQDDRTLFDQIASGDEFAFQQIFEKFKTALTSYLYRFTKSPDIAKDLTQEIFLKLWINRECLSGIESPQHYLFVLAKNRAVDHLRRVALDLRMRETLWGSIIGNRNPTEEEVYAEDSARLVNEAIYKLSNQKQTVFRLSRIEGLTHDQIAVQLHISKNTVKNHIVASVKFIRNYLLGR